jgi:hypothetical protein
MKQEEDQSPYVDYFIVAMSNSLDEKITHAKVFSSHCYEQQKLMEKMMIQICQTFTTW